MDLIDDSYVVNNEQLVALTTLKLVDSETPPASILQLSRRLSINKPSITALLESHYNSDVNS